MPHAKTLRLAISLLAAPLSLAPTAASCQDFDYMRALALERYDMPDSALVYFNKAVAGSPSRADILVSRGSHFLAHKMQAEALRDFTRANALERDVASYQMARAYSMSGDSTKACEWLSSYIKLPGKITEKEVRLDHAFRNISGTSSWAKLWTTPWYSDGDKAVAAIEKLLSNKDFVGAQDLIYARMAEAESAHLHFLNARCWEGLQNSKAAEKEYLHAISRDRKNPCYNSCLAAFYLGHEKDKKAVEYYTTCMKLAPDSSRYLRERAKAYHLDGDVDASAHDLERYLSVNFLDAPMWFLQGLNKLNEQRYLDAIECLNKAIDLAPKMPEYFIARARVLSGSKDFQPAEKDYSSALSLGHDNIQALLERGEVRLNLKRETDACADFVRARDLGSHEALILYNRNCTEK